MSENPALTAMLARRAEKREENPDQRKLSTAEIILLSSVEKAIQEAMEILAKYGSIEIAAWTAVLTGGLELKNQTATAVIDQVRAQA